MGKKILAFIFLFFVSLLLPLQAYATTEAGNSAETLVASSEAKIDKRPLILKTYLKTQNSPLADYADTFVKAADDNNIDWRLVAAISGVESTFGKQIPYNCYNAWGWGIYGDNRLCFTSWDEAIQTISKGIRQRYMDKWGAKDVYQIGKSYAASPTWAIRVDDFMTKMGDFAAKDPSALSISL